MRVIDIWKNTYISIRSIWMVCHILCQDSSKHFTCQLSQTSKTLASPQFTSWLLVHMYSTIVNTFTSPFTTTLLWLFHPARQRSPLLSYRPNYKMHLLLLLFTLFCITCFYLRFVNCSTFLPWLRHLNECQNFGSISNKILTSECSRNFTGNIHVIA